MTRFAFSYTENLDPASGPCGITFRGPGVPSRDGLYRISLTDAERLIVLLQAAFEAGKRVRSGEILTLLKGDVAEGMR